MKTAANASNIQVALRKRPLLQREIENGNSAEIVEVANNKQINLLDPDEINKRYNLNYNINKSRFKETHFTFDYVFDEDATNQQVYQEIGQLYLGDVIEGFNTTIFAYGATSSGKTYTMIGQKDIPGMMDMVMDGLFERAKSKGVTHDVVIRVAYMEIYNENLKDLLSAEQKNLDLREDPKSDVTQVHGLTEVEVTDPLQVGGLLRLGSRNRSKDSTIANEASSRSHAILQITVECVDRAEGLEKEMVVSKLSLVDLAGSERAWANKTKANKLEGAKINQSLLTLGNCISALSEMNEKGPQKNTFIPYRGSKLTRLLKDSLGGNCRTVMIANISGSILSFEDTYNTLQYANRAKNIKVHVQKNVISTSNHVANYAAIIEKLNKENDNLRNILNSEKATSSVQRLPQIHPIQLSSSSPQTQQNNNLVFQQLDEQQQQIKEQLEQAIKQQFDDEVGYIRTIQEAQMKLDKIGRMNLQLQAEIQRAMVNESTQTQYKEQQAINNQGAESLQRQIQELSNGLRNLQEGRKTLQQRIKQSGLPGKHQLLLANLLSSGELTSVNVEKEFLIRKRDERIREKEAEISELSEQLNLRDKILIQQKTLLKQNNIMSSKQQIDTKLKDANIILASIQTTINTPLVQSQQGMYANNNSSNNGYSNMLSQKQQPIDFSDQKRLNHFSNLSLHGKSLMTNNVSPNNRMPYSSNKSNDKKSLQINNRNMMLINDLKALNSNKSSKMQRRNLPSAKSQAAISTKNHTVSSSPGNEKKRPIAGLFPYLNARKAKFQNLQSLQQQEGNNNSNILSSLSPAGKRMTRKRFNYSLMDDQQSTENVSYSDTNLSPHSRIPQSNFYSNIVNKYQNHVYSIQNLDSYDSQSRKSANQTPKTRQRTVGAVIKAQSQRNLPVAQQRKNVLEYDVHQSPYVQSFKNPEQLAVSRKNKLQQLNLNLDNLKDLYTKKYYNNSNNP